MKIKSLGPEKIVEKDVLAYCSNMGWFVSVVDSSAVYSAKSGGYRRGMAKKGFPDIVGCDHNGRFVAIELKAKGKLSTIRAEQKAYLNKATACGAFAVCVDSADLLHKLYIEFISSLISRKDT